MKNPCHNCEKRVVGCHSSCEDYKTFREEKDRQNVKIRAESITADYEVKKQERIRNKQAKRILKDGRDRRI